jgi:hypothetical protein
MKPAVGSGVIHMVQLQADSDARMEHVTLCHKHQQSNCKQKCFLWGLPRGYIRRADGSFELVRSSEIGSGSAGRQSEKADPGPW